MKADKDFAGFEPSDTVFMAIGTVKTAAGTAQLLTYWIGRIDVE
jgi:hypothetical protein